MSTTEAARTLRAIAGLLLILALGYIAISLHGSLDRANAIVTAAGEPGASAVQITQLYTQACFEALIALGVAFGLYLFSRSLD